MPSALLDGYDAGGYPQTPFLSFSSARRKELKEASTPSKASPYMGRMQLIPGRDRPPSKFWYGSPAFALNRLTLSTHSGFAMIF